MDPICLRKQGLHQNPFPSSAHTFWRYEDRTHIPHTMDNVYMKASEAQIRANKKYEQKFDRLQIRVSFEERTEINQHTEKTKEAINAFVHRAIMETIERDNATEKCNP